MDVHSESNVQKLCKNIKDKIDKNEELENLFDSMFMVCCGPTQDIVNPVLKLMTSEELLLTVVNINKSTEFLKTKADLCVKIFNSFISHSIKKDWQTIVLLFKMILESDYKDKNKFVLEVWDKKELYTVPAELILLLVEYEPILIERMLVNMYLSRNVNREHKDVWKNVTYCCWIRWCSASPELFLIITSILNQFLIEVKVKATLLKNINDFIINVMEECKNNKSNFFNLYPLEYQSFVVLLIIEPDINPSKKEIIKKLMSMKNVNTSLLLLFLSHFPLWMDLINIF